MKNTFKISIIALLAMFLIFSCVKNNDNEQQLTIDEAKVSATMAMNTKEERKVSFRLLNAAEKAEVWKRHLSECATDGTLSDEQKGFLNSIIPALNAKRFAKSLNKGDKDAQLEEWQSQSVQLFKPHEVAWLMNDFVKEKPVYTPIPENIKEKLLNRVLPVTDPSTQVGSRYVQDCGCSASSDWCGGFQGLKGCYASTKACIVNSGCPETWGCGSFGVYNCVGGCVTITVNICN